MAQAGNWFSSHDLNRLAFFPLDNPRLAWSYESLARFPVIQPYQAMVLFVLISNFRAKMRLDLLAIVFDEGVRAGIIDILYALQPGSKFRDNRFFSLQGLLDHSAQVIDEVYQQRQP
jgi:hypothetical protein